MRKIFRTLAIAAVAAALPVFASSALHADDDADNEKVAKEALDKAVARGKDLFHGKDVGPKSCAACHENPDKPNLDLKTRAFCYPAYSKKAKVVVTLQQKINEMVKGNSKGKEMDPAGPDIAALEAYIVSLKAK